MGGLPDLTTPLNLKKTGEAVGAGYRVEKIVFESRPKNYVTANLYIPDNISGKTGAVLFVCGHAEEAKGYDQYQTCCQYFAQAGLVALAMDPVGQGERMSYWDPAQKKTTVNWGTTEHDYAGAQCLPLGDADGALLSFTTCDARDRHFTRRRPGSRPAADRHHGKLRRRNPDIIDDDGRPAHRRGSSGTFIMNRRTYLLAGGGQDAEQIWPGFSACGFDHEDIVLAMAPRPVCVLAVTSDFFPIEGTRETVARTRRFWEMCGRPADLKLQEDDSTHAYTPALARAAAAFFCKHLRGAECKLDPAKIKLAPARDLFATQAGQVKGEFSDAVFVHESNAARAKELSAQRQAIPAAQRKKNAIEWLRSRVFKNRIPCDLNPRYYQKGSVGGLSVETAMWWAQEGIFNTGSVLRPTEHAGKTLPVTLAVWNGGTRPALEAALGMDRKRMQRRRRTGGLRAECLRCRSAAAAEFSSSRRRSRIRIHA